MNRKVLIIFLYLIPFIISAESISIFSIQKEAELALEGKELFNSIALFKEVIELNPSFFNSRLGLSMAYFQLGEYEEASIHIKEAMFLNKNSIEAMILYGRILTGQGDFLGARAVYMTIITEQKNNIDAILGLAELEVAEGNIINAIDLYEKFLNKFPKNRKALVSSIILFDSIQKNDISNEYLEQVLFLYPENSHVNFIASKHYFEAGRIDTALVYATRSHEIDPLNQDIIYLLSLIYISQEKYDLAVYLIENNLENTRDNPSMWYLLGEIYIKLGNIDKSIYCFATSLGYGSQNELSRLALENTLIQYKPIDDPLREKYAKFHFKNGIDLISRNFANQARNEFRRGLILAPHSIEGQKLYAHIMKTNGFLSKYLSILETIYLEESEDIEMTDEIEIYKSIISDTVSTRWSLDQFLIESPRFDIEIFLNKTSIPGNKLNEGSYLGSYLIHSLHGFENIDASFHDIPSDFSSAFNISRKTGSDYFLMIDFIDTERSFSMEAKIYHSGTGSLLSIFPIFRTGNQKIVLSLNKLSLLISESLPVVSEIIDRKFDRILINNGNIQGTNTGDVFYIIRNEDLSLKKDSIGLEFDPFLLLGEVEIIKTDDLVSEGILKKYNFFDLINPGDSLFKKTDTMDFSEIDSTQVNKSIYVDLYKSIISIP